MKFIEAFSMWDVIVLIPDHCLSIYFVTSSMLILMQKITKESNLTFKLWDMTDSESKFKDISSITVNTNAISSIFILNIEKV